MNMRIESCQETHAVRRKLWIVLAMAALALAGTGCENYGKLQRDRELTQAFENLTLPREYIYYYYGRENMPYAVMGVGSEYRLQSELWQAVDLQDDRLKNMIKWIWTDHNYAPYGAYILGPGGDRVGIWYSSINHAAINVNADQKTVGVIPDKPFLRDGPSK
jgi:hypothetical protein